MTRTEILHRTPDLVGTTFLETVAGMGGSTELHGVVTACQASRVIAFRLGEPFNAVDVEYRLEEVRDGTRLTMRAVLRFKGVLKVLGPLLWPALKRRVLAQFRAECAELKRLCETPRFP